MSHLHKDIKHRMDNLECSFNNIAVLTLLKGQADVLSCLLW